MITVSIIILLIVLIFGVYFYKQSKLHNSKTQTISKSEEVKNGKIDLEQQNESNISSAKTDSEDKKTHEKLNEENTLNDADEKQSTVVENEDVNNFTMDGEAKEAFILIDEGKIDQAITLLEENANSKQTADSFAWLAAAYGKKIDSTENITEIMTFNKKMINSLNTAFSIKSDSLEATFVRGNKYLNTPSMFGGDVKKALEDFQKCLNSGIVNEDLYAAAAEAYRKIGDTEKEKEFTDKVQQVMQNKNTR
ncbi:hypothetical protein [Bacillus sp. REN10]|uniref:tetratricopeptide repeat protein n=1 Tax=Bacillus sp. REN10 TaxID=2782541 RepID=UPI00193B5C5E|nr:hypothetical protein [Bacillus sp. REN10]